MGKKWVKIDPATIKVGDRVKVDFGNGTVMKGTVDHFNDYGHVYFGSEYMLSPSASGRTWYVRQPKQSVPLTRPGEPPVGTFFRVERTGRVFARVTDEDPMARYNYQRLPGAPADWKDITEPGDTIVLLDLMERES